MDAILLLSVLLFSIVVHEVSQAWQARREGDPTAERLGRITLNPISHLDPVGSFIVPLVLHVSGSGFIFGWAKPVPVDPRNYRDPKWGDIRVSLAGIASNLMLACGFTVAGAVLYRAEVWVGPLAGVVPALQQMMVYGIFINLILAFFNLIPIPPLDGSHVLYHLLPEKLRPGYRRAGRYGLLVLMGLFFLVPGMFRFLLWPVTFFMGAADAFIRLWI